MIPWFQKLKQKFTSPPKKATIWNDKKRIKGMDELDENSTPWWGPSVIEEEQSRYFTIGNIILCLDRFNREWHITSYQENDIPKDFLEKPSKARPKKPYKTFAAQASNEITLKPILPDRALLSHLEQPFYIPIGETLLFYISSPLWIRIEAGTPATLLDEIPTEILADTWFGKNTLEGELCYANESQSSPRLEELIQDNTRVITPINIVNRSRETLLLHELKVPLPNLSVYCDGQNHLWTEQLNLFQDDYGSFETVVVKGSPKNLKNVRLLQRARFGYKQSFRNLLNPFMWK